MEPLTGEALEKRIAELEQERDELLRTTEFVRYKPGKTSHSRIRLRYNQKISLLRKYGVEEVAQIPGVTKKRCDTNKAKYGYANGNVIKSQQTKERLYGQRGLGNYAKMKETFEHRYGHANGNVKAMTLAKIDKYGNGGCGNYDKVRQTNLERHGIPWFCMTQKCRQANGFSKSKLNYAWRDKLS